MRVAGQFPAALTALLVLSAVAGAVALPVGASGAAATDNRGVVGAADPSDVTTVAGTDGDDDTTTDTDGDTDDEDDDTTTDTDGDTDTAVAGAEGGTDGERGSPLWPWLAIVAILFAGGLLGRRVVGGGGGEFGGAGDASGGSTAGGTVSKLLGSVQSAVESGHAMIETARAEIADHFWGLLGLGGYAKRAGDEPLEHDIRATLYDRIQSDPGVYLSAIAADDRVDAGFGTVRYHLKILEREGLIESEKVDGKRRYSPIGVEPGALALAMDGDTPAAILETLRHEPKTVSALADAVDRAPSTVTHHLDSLRADGLVIRRREGETVMNELAPGVDEEMGGLSASPGGSVSEETAES